MSAGTRRATKEEVPIIDLGGCQFTDEGHRRRLAEAVTKAACGAGFFYIVNHGLPNGDVDGMFEISKKFFALPIADKEEVSVTKAGLNFTGYLPVSHKGSDKKLKADLHEAFQINLELPADDPDAIAGLPMHGPNMWPSAIPDLKPKMLAYEDALFRLGMSLMSLFETGLDVPPGTFNVQFKKPMLFLRLLHYPPQPAVGADGPLGTRAHADTGVITILAQDDVGGLEVLLKSGEWVSVPPVPHAFIINLGDVMKYWTDGVFAATPHRVINASGKERYSIAFFLNPDYHTKFDRLLENPDRKQEHFQSLYANKPGECYGDWIKDVFAKIYFDPAAKAD
jgi:isopenicillin N synthase-like dioxygenase